MEYISEILLYRSYMAWYLVFLYHRAATVNATKPIQETIRSNRNVHLALIGSRKAKQPMFTKTAWKNQKIPSNIPLIFEGAWLQTN